MNKWRKVAVWIGLIVISLIFIQAGVIKLMGVPMMVEVFNKLGYPVWFRFAIGIIEIISAILLLIRKYSFYGAAVLALIMVGAIASVLGKGLPNEAIMPAFLFCVLLWIAVARKPANRKESNKETTHDRNIM